MSATKPNSVIIVGGSLAGLLHGLYLKRHGVDVTILDQDPSAIRSSHKAGIGFDKAVEEILTKYDDTGVESFIPAVGARIAFRKHQDVKRIKALRHETSWGLLYYILRANFDGLASAIVPAPPPSRAGDGKSKYLVGKKVTELIFPDGGISEGEGTGSRLSVKYSVCGADGSIEDGEQGLIGADLVIGADGRYSTVRDLLSTAGPTKTEYSGYVAWRGAVLETEVSSETAKYFENMTSTNILKGSYVLA